MPIEKNGGCNRILCQKCSHEFCWMCMNPWSVHGYNPCNRFDEEQVKNAQGEQERARALLDRYLHYFNRFKNHQQSLKLEKKVPNPTSSHVTNSSIQIRTSDFSCTQQLNVKCSRCSR